MKGYTLKAKTALGTAKKVSGKIEILKGKNEELLSFRNLQGSLKGKILIIPAEIPKSILEKARALGVSGIVGKKIADEYLTQLENELKTSWLSFSFALLIIEEGLEEILDKVEGKTGTIEVKEKRLIIV
ncbi:hypothetical protein ISS86_01650 [Candidatus Microgenomates bacterium]|nr:hypothetical protein [Candidatus Microgenomates bacterium]